MNRKKITIILCLFIIVFGIIVAYSFHANRKAEDKKGVLTIFDVGAKETSIEYNDKIIILTDEKRKEFIGVLKNISNGKEDDLNESINYDMIIDFNNGYSGKISTDSKIFLLVDDAKENSYYDISEENIDKILKFVN